MHGLPRDWLPDSTLTLLADGYEFVMRRCRRLQSDAFVTRLMLRRAVCVLGADAARMFYAPDRFTRRGALPRTALWLLQDEGSAFQLDGAAHHHRKQVFLSLMAPESVQRLADLVDREWHAALSGWERRRAVVLHDAVQEILGRAVCAWTGVPLAEEKARQRTQELAITVENAGAIGPRLLWGLLLRARSERWLRGLVAGVRASTMEAPEGSPLQAIAWHRDLDGRLLDADVAAVELLNLLRPTVAVAWFITFAALALHQYPACHQRLERDLAAGDEEYLGWFVQEVRRFYPFFPVVGGRALRAFAWRGQHFPAGSWFLLDLYGTNHDPRIWDAPDEFCPERFRAWSGDPFTLIPQGGGDHATTHRCPGEWITIALMQQAVRLLVTAMRYTVPPQDLRVSLARMPTLPASRFVIQDVRPASRSARRVSPAGPASARAEGPAPAAAADAERTGPAARGTADPTV